MIYTVLFLDAEGDKVVRDIWQALADKSVSTSMLDKGVQPHITLGMFKSTLSDDLPQSIEAFVKQLPALPIMMSYYGIFTAPYHVIFLGVTVTDALYNLHRRFYQQFSTALDLTTLFVPKTWVPHCTLADELTSEKVSPAFEVCQSFPSPIVTYANRLALVESDTMEILHNYSIG